MCTPLPTPYASGIGENDARCPSRCAAARAISRVITAWSAAVSAGGRRHRHLELARAVFGQERVRRHAGGAHRGDEASRRTCPGGGTRPGCRRRRRAPRCRYRRTPARTRRSGAGPPASLQRGDARGAGIRAGSTPTACRRCCGCRRGRSVRAREPSAKSTRTSAAGSGTIIRSPRGAERGVEDRSEGGLHQVGVGPADALAAARFDLARREALAAHVAGDVAGADEDQFLAQHVPLLLNGDRVYPGLRMGENRMSGLRRGAASMHVARAFALTDSPGRAGVSMNNRRSPLSAVSRSPASPAADRIRTPRRHRPLPRRHPSRPRRRHRRHLRRSP